MAQRFGKEGFRVALVARSAERLAEGVKELGALGIEAQAFTADLSDPARIEDAFWELHSARAARSIAVG